MENSDTSSMYKESIMYRKGNKIKEYLGFKFINQLFCCFLQNKNKYQN